MVAIDIHGLLAKRAGGRGREHRQAEKAAHTGEVHSRAHNSVFPVYVGGHGGNPGVGVVHVKSAKALGISLVGA